MRTGRHLAFVLISLLVAAGPAIHAQELIDRRQRHERQRDRGIESGISLDQTVRMLERRYRAKAVRAETVREGDRRVHKVRLLSADGRVWTESVDAGTVN